MDIWANRQLIISERNYFKECCSVSYEVIFKRIDNVLAGKKKDCEYLVFFQQVQSNISSHILSLLIIIIAVVKSRQILFFGTIWQTYLNICLSFGYTDI